VKCADGFALSTACASISNSGKMLCSKMSALFEKCS
jgi:hypothetical protein